MLQKFVELTRRNNKKYSAENEWFRHCVNKKVPYITVRQHGKTADVQWDHISFSPRMDEGIFSKAGHIHSQAKAIYEPLATSSSWISLGVGVISFKNLSLADANGAAEKLYDLIASVTVPLLQAAANDA